MAEMLRIEHVNKVAEGVSKVTFNSGTVVLVQWSKFAKPGTVFEKLADTDYSTRCRKSEGGYALRWPDGVDWSAEAVLTAGTSKTGALLVRTTGTSSKRRGHKRKVVKRSGAETVSRSSKSRVTVSARKRTSVSSNTGTNKKTRVGSLPKTAARKPK